MKREVTLTCILLSLCWIVSSASAFTSLYVFGDGASTTTDNTTGGGLYYGDRNSNGRVWVEVLAQRQGLTFNSNRNWSYFGDTSSNLISTASVPYTNAVQFKTPADVATALIIIWVSDADFVLLLESSPPYAPSAVWTNTINQCTTNQYKAITNLYGKGVRTMVIPSMVDLGKIPEFDGLPSASLSFIRQQFVNFNNSFSNMLNLVAVQYPALTIYRPDFFSLLDNILASPSSYGVTNALTQLGDGRKVSVDALDDPNNTDYSLTGRGTNYIYWDSRDPTAKVHTQMANLVQQLISPPMITNVTTLANGSNRLDLASVPVGRNGTVLVSSNLTSWTSLQGFTSSNVTQSVFVPTSGNAAHQYYRLTFPFSWTWP